MKISASIYSDKVRPFDEVLDDLIENNVDLIHVDCNDDESVFEDIVKIRAKCDLPIDLHIISEEPKKYFELLRKTPVDYITFQYEQLSERLEIPNDINGKKGIAVITPTPVAIFEEYQDFDFILIMATIPGQSGGKFDVVNFSKIREFSRLYPTKKVHVDGGVNGEVSFILRNMGVDSSVSGSYLFNDSSISKSLMNLTKQEIGSEFRVKDFMRNKEEIPVLKYENATVTSVLKSIDDGKMGVTVIEDSNDNFMGIITNADVRKGLIANQSDFNQMTVDQILNRNPIKIEENLTVVELLTFVKNQSFPILYLPVLNTAGKTAGIVNFTNLIKGEL